MIEVKPIWAAIDKKTGDLCYIGQNKSTITMENDPGAYSIVEASNEIIVLTMVYQVPRQSIKCYIYEGFVYTEKEYEVVVKIQNLNALLDNALDVTRSIP